MDEINNPRVAEPKRADSRPSFARETIFALASGTGIAGIAVIRVSGPRAEEVLGRITGRAPPPPRRAVLRELRDARGELLDEALVLRFSEGRSYTGEPVVELHCHGGRAVVRGILDTLRAIPGCRPARPGEFTRRALEAGRMDLTAVEALGDLIAAETEQQRRQALRVLGGDLARQSAEWRQRLVDAAARIEAALDWADEDIPEDVAPAARALIEGVAAEIARELRLSEGARRLREGFEVAIVGRPNAGKSTLFNRLAGREAAIVSPEPGTTRDVLELRYDLRGLPVVFLDTAGLRTATGAVEAEGVGRAEARAEAAALRIFLRAPDAPPSEAEARLRRTGDVTVWNKADIVPGPADVVISAREGTGVEALLDRVGEVLGERVAEAGLVGHERQRRALEGAESALRSAAAALANGELELCADDLRAAFRALERLLGRIDVEDVLDEVFARFCLGK